MRFGHTLYSTHPSKTPLVMLKKILIAIIVIAGAALDMMAQKNADKIQRTIDAGSANNALNRAVSRLDEVELVSVPEELMRTVYDFTVGWKVADDAKQIRMFLINPLAVITPMVYNFVRLDEPSAGTQGKYDYYEESYEDVFVLPLKKDAIQFVVDPAA